MRRNGYGLCTGKVSPKVNAGANQAPFAGLTPWIHATVQGAAGLDSGPEDLPLTFGNLWTLSKPSDRARADAAKSRAIDLAMIASDISRNRMIQLPFFET